MEADQRPVPPPPDLPPPKATAYRHVPYDIEIEQALLGTILVDNHALDRVGVLLKAEHFYDPMHQRIFDTMATALERGAFVVTPLTLHAAMKADPGLMEVGGATYLAGLASAAPAFANVRDYARIITDLAVRRRLITVGEEIVNLAYEPPAGWDIGAAADEMGESLYQTAHVDNTGRGPEFLIDAIDRAIQLAETAIHAPERARILTGIRPIDDALGGLFPGEITFLGAAPSQGKSGLGAQLGLSAARHVFMDGKTPAQGPQGYATLVFSQEMSSEEWAMRYIAQEARVPANRIMEGRLSASELERVVLSRQHFMGLPFKIDGSTSLKVSQIRARAQAMKRNLGRLDLVLVDHLGFCAPANDRLDEKGQLKQITRDLKAIAKDLGCAMLVITHLNRDFWKRANQRPLISDLYGSSAIEQNADHIWFLHREEYYLERNVPDCSDAKAYEKWETAMQAAAGWAEIFSTKRRMGPVGTAKVKFDGPLVRFSDPLDPPMSPIEEARLQYSQASFIDEFSK